MKYLRNTGFIIVITMLMLVGCKQQEEELKAEVAELLSISFGESRELNKEKFFTGKGSKLYTVETTKQTLVVSDPIKIMESEHKNEPSRLKIIKDETGTVVETIVYLNREDIKQYSKEYAETYEETMEIGTEEQL